MRLPSSSVSRALLLAATLVVPALVAPAMAQQAAPAAPATAAKPPSPAQLQLARDLVAVNGEGRAFDGLISNIVEGAARRFLQTNPDLAKQLGEAGMQVATEMEKRKGEILEILANAYAARFTEAELKEAIAFYRTPTGTKLVNDRPVIVQSAMQNIQAWGVQVNNEAAERIRAELKKRGVNL